MDPPWLSNLAPELIATVFKSLTNLSEVITLALASWLLNDIRKLNADSICDAILPRTIDCFDDASISVKAQAHDKINEDISEQYRNAAGIQRAKCYLSNQTAAREIFGIYEKTSQWVFELARKDKRCSVLSPTEHAHFIHSYYQVWIYHIITSIDGWKALPQAFMIASSKREQLLNIIMMIWFANTVYGRSSLRHFQGEHGQVDYRTMLEYISDLNEQVRGLFINACRLPHLWAVYDEW